MLYLQDIMFILHAEHEMNCSTAAVRHLASSGVDVYTAIAGGVGALYGPLHGGANEAVLRMLERIGTVRLSGRTVWPTPHTLILVIHLVHLHMVSVLNVPQGITLLPPNFFLTLVSSGGEHPGVHRRGQGQEGKDVWIWAPSIPQLRPPCHHHQGGKGGQVITLLLMPLDPHSLRRLDPHLLMPFDTHSLTPLYIIVLMATLCVSPLLPKPHPIAPL